MSQPFLGEIRLFAGNFAPLYWHFCDGALLSIAENQTLFDLIGITYGGDGQTTFALPDLRGRIPIHQGTDPINGDVYTLGQMDGTEQVTLTTQQIPSHYHSLLASNNNGTVVSPDGSPNPVTFPAKDPTGNNIYSTLKNDNAVDSGSSGGTLPHENLPPFLCVSFIIALAGIYPFQ